MRAPGRLSENPTKPKMGQPGFGRFCAGQPIFRPQKVDCRMAEAKDCLDVFVRQKTLPNAVVGQEINLNQA